MNASRTAVHLLLLLSITLMVPGQVWGQSGAPGTKLRRVVLPDTETMVSSASQWRVTGKGRGKSNALRTAFPNWNS
jgi:hypothetical protein